MTDVREKIARAVVGATALGMALALSAAAAEPDKRAKRLEFGDTMVENAGKGPSDYASTARKYRDRKRGRLYRREIAFEKDLEETLGEMRYAP